jgi:hypothetical protein
MTQFHTNIPRSSRSSGSQASMTSFRQPAPERLLSLTRSSLDALEQQQAEEEYGMIFDLSTSGRSTQSSHDEKASMGSRIGLGIDIDEKPLPRIPPDHERNKSGQTPSGFDDTFYRQCTASSGSLETPLQMGFSFKPGDDADILAQTTTRNLKTRSMVGTRPYQMMRTASSESKSEASNTTLKSAEGTWHLKSPLSIYKSKLQSKPGQDVQDRESLQRDDSTSSIVTAIRDNSGRGSVDSSRQSSQGGRQKLNRNSGSNEAITAAARALASASVSIRNSSTQVRSSGTREESIKKGEGPRIAAIEDISKKLSQKINSSRSEV